MPARPEVAAVQAGCQAARLGYQLYGGEFVDLAVAVDPKRNYGSRD